MCRYALCLSAASCSAEQQSLVMKFRNYQNKAIVVFLGVNENYVLAQPLDQNTSDLEILMNALRRIPNA